MPLRWKQSGRQRVDGAGAVLLVGGIIGNVGGGHLADRIGRRMVMVGSGLAGTIVSVAFVLTGTHWQWPRLGLPGIALFASLPPGILAGQDLVSGKPVAGRGSPRAVQRPGCTGAAGVLDPLVRACGTDAELWAPTRALRVLAAAPFALPDD